jgi:hypothetical protein
MTDQERFTEAYLEAMDFTELGDGEQPPKCAQLTALSRCNALNACKNFWWAYGPKLKDHVEQAGHDFWLTRQGHGTGFWDRPEVYGRALADALTLTCKAIGEVFDVDYGERVFGELPIGSHFFDHEGDCFVKTGTIRATKAASNTRGIKFLRMDTVWGIGL